MKIVIAGAGAVGGHLAKLLSRENHDITLIDDDSTRLRSLENSYDLSVLEGSATSLTILRNAGVSEADLFVGVTKNESQNINACILAHELGAKKTVARVDSEDLMEHENRARLAKLGVEKLIYPELLAAEEIAQSIRQSWVRQWIDFNGGKLLVLAVKVRDNAPIVNKRLMDLKGSQNYRIVTIKREEETIIPGGHTEILAGDVVYFITTPDYIDDVRKQAGKKLYTVKDMIVMGGGKIAVKTVKELSGVNIKMFEKDEKKVRKLVEQEIGNALVLQGDATDIELLKEENIDDADAFVALTDNSEANILACLAARRHGVQKIVAEVENVDYIPLAERMDIGVIINKMEIAATYIYRLSLSSDIRKVKRMSYADAEIVELTAKEGSKITKGFVKDLNLPLNMFIGGVIRNGESFIVNGMSEIFAGDKVVVFCLKSSIKRLSELFN